MELLPYQHPERQVHPATPSRTRELFILVLVLVVVLAVLALWPRKLDRETVEGWIAAVPLGSSPAAYQAVFDKHGFECWTLTAENEWSMSDGGYRPGDLDALQGIIDGKGREDNQWMRWVVTIRFDSNNKSRSVVVYEYWTPD